MDEVRYHPLITDDESCDLIPMFNTNRITAVANNKFYLEEIIPRYYRLCSKNEITETQASEYRIHCPYCGNIMQPIASSIDAHKHYLCRCTKC